MQRLLVMTMVAAAFTGCPSNAYQCNAENDCSGGFRCFEDACHPVCSVNAPCENGLACDVPNGVCREAGEVPDAGATVTSSSSGATSGVSGVSSSTQASSLGRSSSVSGATSRSTSAPSQGSSSAANSAGSSAGGTSSASSAAATSAGLSTATSSSSSGGSSNGSTSNPGSSSSVMDPCRDGNGTIVAGATCDDGDVCTVDDRCDIAGACQPGADPCAANTFHPQCSPVDGTCGCATDASCGTGGLCFGGRCLISKELRISPCSNDAHQEEYGNGDVIDNNSNPLLNNADDFLGLRFTNTGIPAGSRVFHAFAVITVGSVYRDAHEDWSLVMDPLTPAIQETDGNLSSRAPRSATQRMDGEVPAGPNAAPEFAAEVEALVAMSTWTPATGAIMFVADRFTDSDLLRVYMCEDGDGRGPRLRLQYAPP